MAIQNLGVIGAGLMGNGIAHVAAVSGLDVTLVDVNAAALEKALATIGKNLDRQVSRSLISADDKLAALARITTATEQAPLAACDMVIEAATEKEAVKIAIFKSGSKYFRARSRRNGLKRLKTTERRRSNPPSVAKPAKRWRKASVC